MNRHNMKKHENNGIHYNFILLLKLLIFVAPAEVEI